MNCKKCGIVTKHRLDESGLEACSVCGTERQARPTIRCDICGNRASAHANPAIKIECDEARQRLASESLARNQHGKDAGHEGIPF